MGLFGKSFEEKVEEALQDIRSKIPEVKGLAAALDGKIVTLTGEAPDKETRSKVMQGFSSMVEADNVVNGMRIAAAPAPERHGPPAPEDAAAARQTVRLHEVVSGDTLGGIAKKYYGNAGQYMKIFEANRDILDDPNLIKVGQKLKIPE